MIIQGKYVLITKPEIDKKPSGIELGEDTLKQMEEELMAKFEKLEVYQVGTEVEFVKKGDIVNIPPAFLRHADVIFLENKPFFLVPESKCVMKY